MMAGLTRQQAAARDFIADYIAAHGGVSPSYDEIAGAIGLKSKNGIHRIVTALIARGVLKRSGHARGLSLVRRQCPHCGGDLDAPPLHMPAPKIRQQTGYAVNDFQTRRMASAMRAAETR